ncbi:hypothetical protein ABIA69_000724 [Lysinibacillus parviboronicapiens]|uniref:Uncharacterized protein n=1 Tax=Lysinibacillus parviboronicapiens TaxID=436516 RepID=A0ABV2PFM6_9BACI|nr:hypothetical protein [Lysinibacillus parviboronicapiens]
MEEKRYVMSWNNGRCYKAYKYNIIDDPSDYVEDQWDYKIDTHKCKVDKNHDYKKDKFYHEDHKCRSREIEIERYKDDVCFNHEDDKGDHQFYNNCKNCICDQLRKLEPGTLVDIFLSSGVSFCAITFISLDPKNCCAHFLETDETYKSLIVDCQKIDAIRRNLC